MENFLTALLTNTRECSLRFWSRNSREQCSDMPRVIAQCANGLSNIAWQLTFFRLWFCWFSLPGTEQPAEVTSLTNRVGPVTATGLRTRPQAPTPPQPRRENPVQPPRPGGPPRMPLPPPGMPRPWGMRKCSWYIVHLDVCHFELNLFSIEDKIRISQVVTCLSVSCWKAVE